MAAFGHILVATDFSETSRGAIDVACELASDSGAALTLVHTCEVPVYTEVPVPPDVMVPIVDGARARLEDLVRSLQPACPRAKAITRVGVPWEQILAAAEEVGADLIVLGTHGRRGLAHALIGSVAERVVRLAPVPVLTVRSRAPAARSR